MRCARLQIIHYFIKYQMHICSRCIFLFFCFVQAAISVYLRFGLLKIYILQKQAPQIVYSLVTKYPQQLPNRKKSPCIHSDKPVNMLPDRTSCILYDSCYFTQSKSYIICLQPVFLLVYNWHCASKKKKKKKNRTHIHYFFHFGDLSCHTICFFSSPSSARTA